MELEVLCDVPSVEDAVLPCDVLSDVPCESEVVLEIVSPRLNEAPRELDTEVLSEEL